MNSDREEGVALLEAHSFKKYALAGVQPYYVKDGEVLFRNQPLKTGRVGLALEQPQNDCLNSAVLVSGEQLKALHSATSRSEVSKLFKEAVKHSRNDPTLQESLLLRVDNRNVVLWDYQRQRVIILQRAKFQSLSQTICEKREITLQ